MDELNLTEAALPVDHYVPVSDFSFPAWVPAVTVAVGMLAFLGGSFYIRHRKVVKKRQLLMDYFYIIFQYGGLRRKRMVAALCNTNAITLRELGRSFMISFDSIANTDNSCPFYLEDTAFSNAQGSLTPQVQKRAFFKNKGMGSSRRCRGPFRRYNTQSEDMGPNPVSFQDIIMKFKAKRTDNNTALSARSPRPLHSPHIQGSSMCTIHGDEIDFHNQNYVDERTVPGQYHKQRRNAYIVQYDSSTPKFADVVTEVNRRSLGNAPDTFRVDHGYYPGKRNSEPWENSQTGLTGPCSQPPDVFHVHSKRLSPSDVFCGSQGFIPKAYERSSSFQPYRNSEPTILIHSPSTDHDTSQGWTDIRHKYTNGIVFLKRVPKTDGAPGEYYYEEQKPLDADSSRRASLSKVSYVPSGNMNEYYNCFHTAKKDNSKTSKNDQVSPCPIPSPSLPGPSKSKKSRLSLGEIAISNFNRRIDLASESLHEYEAEVSLEKKGSQDASSSGQQRGKPKTTWTKFKNVFTGSRTSQSLDTQFKVVKTVTSVQERPKRRSRRHHTRWQRFVNVFTGFRSLPETKKSDTSVEVPKISSSLPMGLDMQLSCSQDSLDEVESELENVESSILRNSESSGHLDPSFSVHTEQEDVVTKGERPTTLPLPSKTHSFPEELLNGRQYYQRFRNVFQASRSVQNYSPQFARLSGRRYRKRNDPVSASSMSLPQAKRDFNAYSFQAGYSPFRDEYRFVRGGDQEEMTKVVTPGRLQGTEEPLFNQRFRSLSPLPEKISFSPKKTEQPNTLKTNTEPDSISQRSVYMTPSERDTGPQHTKTEDCFVNMNLVADQCTNRQHAPLTISQSVPFVRGSTSNTDYDRSCSTSDLAEIQFQSLAMKTLTSAASIKLERSSALQLPLEISPPKTTFDPGYRLPQAALLTPDHRLAGLSTDSVYYDTVSAVSSPTLGNYMIQVGGPGPFPPINVSEKMSELTSETHFHFMDRLNVIITPSSSTPNAVVEDIGTLGSSITHPSHQSGIVNSFYHSRSSAPSDFLSNSSYNVGSDSPSLESLGPVPDVYSSTALTHSDKTPLKQTMPLKSNISTDRSSMSAFGLPSQDSSSALLGEESPVQSTSQSLECSIECQSVDRSTSRPETLASNMKMSSPSREHGEVKQSGYLSPEEEYKAKVSRLPRFSRRASLSSPAPYDMIHNKWLPRTQGAKRNVAMCRLSMAIPEVSASTGASHVQISPYDTLI